MLLDDHLIPKEKTYVFKRKPLIIWICIILVGIMMKIQHWPGAVLLTTLGAAGLSGYSFSGWKSLRGKDPVNNAMCILSIIWFLRIVVGILFFSTYPLSLQGIIAYIVFALLTFGTYEWLKKRAGFR